MPEINISELKTEENDRVITLIESESKFILTKSRYPAYVSAWGTGKTLAGIGRAIRLTENYKRNLGIIFRKEFTDLRDSTIKDFEEYTGLNVSSSREVRYPNGSIIMFRHLEEMNNIQNVNLGWFWIEQAEELETDDQFFKLFGRLRRKGVEPSGFITANTNGHNWVWRLWKNRGLVRVVEKLMSENPGLFSSFKSGDEVVQLFEAKTYDNKHNLSPDFIASLEMLKIEKPKLYNRFVLNSWDDADMTDAVIPAGWIDEAMKRTTAKDGNVYFGVDVARFGDDQTVIFPIKGRRALPYLKLHGNDTMQVCGQIVRMAEELNPLRICIDTIGIGSGVYDRLKELKLPVMEVNVAMPSMEINSKTGKPKFKNLRSEVWWKARESIDPRPEIQSSPCSLPDDQELREQLATPKYTINSSGQIEVESKDDMKERLGHSPDIADAYCLAVFGALGGRLKPSAFLSGSTMFGSGRQLVTSDWM